MLCLSCFELYSRWVPLIFLDYFILLCNAQIGSQALVTVVRTPERVATKFLAELPTVHIYL